MIYQVFVYQLCFNFSLALVAVINVPANRLLTQIGVKNSPAETRACFPVEFLSLRIIMSFRKPCHMPFRKLIPPLTLTGILGLKSNQDLGKPLTLERFLECLNVSELQEKSQSGVRKPNRKRTLISFVASS